MPWAGAGTRVLPPSPLSSHADMFSRPVVIAVDASPAEVTARLRRVVASEGRVGEMLQPMRRGGFQRIRLFGSVGSDTFELRTGWRPSFFRQHYSLWLSGTLESSSDGTTVRATIAPGFALYAMLAGVLIVCAVAVATAARTDDGLPSSSGFLLIVAGVHLFSAWTSFAEAESALRQAVGAGD
jgi:hypothetical protein